ncbi:hypothetical protein AHAS_Ahas06G0181700 [Arachis hypogaea]
MAATALHKFLCCHLFYSTTLLSALRTSPQLNSSCCSFLASSKLPWRSPFIWCTSPLMTSHHIPIFQANFTCFISLYTLSCILSK